MRTKHAVLLVCIFLAFIPRGYTCAKHDTQESEPMDEEQDSMIDVSIRKRRNIIDNAKDTVSSTNDKLRWIKKNFRYLFLMVASGFVLFFSCAVYRRCTRDNTADNDDGIQVVVVGGPRQHYTNTPPTPTQELPSRPPPPKQSKPKKPPNSKPKSFKNKKTKKTTLQSKKVKTRAESCCDSDEGSICRSVDSSEQLLNPCIKYNGTDMGEGENGDTQSFRNLKDPLPRGEITSRVVHEGIPLSCFMSYQQLTDMGSHASYLSQYLHELRLHAAQLHAEDTAFAGHTSMDMWPIVEDIYMNDRLSASLHERRGQYYPTASPDTQLPITAAAN